MPTCEDCGKEVPEEEFFINACKKCAQRTLDENEKRVKYIRGGIY